MFGVEFFPETYLLGCFSKIDVDERKRLKGDVRADGDNKKKMGDE